MRRLISFLLILLVLVFGFVYWQFHRLLTDINACQTHFSQTCLTTIAQQEPRLLTLTKVLPNSPLKSKLLDLDYLFQNTKSLFPLLPKLLGQDQPITYLIFLGNDQELRANGGFTGSYATLTLTGDLHLSDQNLRFQDIYVPAGQIDGHITPPAPLQKAFEQGTWLLPNFDYYPDFASSSAVARWFMKAANEKNADVVVLLNLSTIKKVLAVLGEFTLPEYNLTLNQDNLYAFLQNQSEVNFFPGSTQKKDALTLVGKAVLNQINSLSAEDKLKIAQILVTDLKSNNLVVNSTNQDIQAVLTELNWTGSPQFKTDNHTLTDLYFATELNYGANKANCCVLRETNHVITRLNQQINHHVELTITNNSTLENPDPPRFYGGNYRLFLRFYLSPQATNLKLTPVPDYPTLPCDIYNGQCTEVGLFVVTKALSHQTITLDYSLPIGQETQYRLLLQKQNGLVSSPQTISLFGKILKTDLQATYETVIPL